MFLSLPKFVNLIQLNLLVDSCNFQRCHILILKKLNSTFASIYIDLKWLIIWIIKEQLPTIFLFDSTCVQKEKCANLTLRVPKKNNFPLSSFFYIHMQMLIQVAIWMIKELLHTISSYLIQHVFFWCSKK